MADDQHPPGWVPELLKLLRAETLDIRRIGGDLVDVLRDLRGELEHLRTARERDERVEQLARDLRPRVRARRG